jgi:hypothetical protein
MSLSLSESSTLPCGAGLKNRIAKSAMSENKVPADFPGNNASRKVCWNRV